MLKAILDRRSIRKYKDENVPQSIIKEIIQAGILAPSSKNRQPWKFVVVTKTAKDNMVEVMRKRFIREKTAPLLPESKKYLSDAEYTLGIMQQAPVVILL